MDSQALAFVKLAERHLARFDPDQEDEYYKSAGNVPWCVSAIAGLALWLLHSGRPTVKNLRRRIGQWKAKTG